MKRLSKPKNKKNERQQDFYDNGQHYRDKQDFERGRY